VEALNHRNDDDEIKLDVKVLVLPCDVMHAFHVDCIKLWLKRSTGCPLCKKNVFMTQEEQVIDRFINSN
jgi:hypothetical protein